MFTGIIEQFGTIEKIETLPFGKRFFIKNDIESLRIGDSIAVNGVCFTVTTLDARLISVEASPETLAKTTMSNLSLKEHVHLELPVSLSKPLGGHFVTGHVDEVLRIASIESFDAFRRYVFEGITQPQWICCKGSITVDGVSLTINRLVSSNSIECMLIPHTLKNTRFNTLKTHDAVNVEYDYLAKIVARQHAVRQDAAELTFSEET
mgnify:CR=1 FL=1